MPVPSIETRVVYTERSKVLAYHARRPVMPHADGRKTSPTEASQNGQHITARAAYGNELFSAPFNNIGRSTADADARRLVHRRSKSQIRARHDSQSPRIQSEYMGAAAQAITSKTIAESFIGCFIGEPERGQPKRQKTNSFMVGDAAQC